MPHAPRCKYTRLPGGQFFPFLRRPPDTHKLLPARSQTGSSNDKTNLKAHGPTENPHSGITVFVIDELNNNKCQGPWAHGKKKNSHSEYTVFVTDKFDS